MKAASPSPSPKDKNLEYEWRYRIQDDAHMKSLIDAARRTLGAKAPRKYLLINHSFVHPADKMTVARVRVSIDVESGREEVSMTVKRLPRTPTEFEEEHEVLVSDSAAAVKMLERLGLRLEYTLEKFRTVVEIPRMRGELDIDEAPGLPPYLEIECSSLKHLKSLAKSLGFPIAPPRFSVLQLYQEVYDVPAASLKSGGDLAFDATSGLTSIIRRNVGRDKTLFAKRLSKQRALAQRAIRLSVQRKRSRDLVTS